MKTNDQNSTEDFLLGLIKADPAQTIREKRRPFSQTELVSAALMFDPSISELEIETEYPKDPFVFTTRDGAKFEGVVTAILEHTVEIRQANGKMVHVFKSAVAAISRP